MSKLIIFLLIVAVGGAAYLFAGDQIKDRFSNLNFDFFKERVLLNQSQESAAVTFTVVSEQTQKPFTKYDVKVKIQNASTITNRSPISLEEKTDMKGQVTFDLVTNVKYDITLSEGTGMANLYETETSLILGNESEHALKVTERAEFAPTNFREPKGYNEEASRILAPVGKYMWTFDIRKIGNGVIKCPILMLEGEGLINAYFWVKSGRGIEIKNSEKTIQKNTPYEIATDDMLDGSDYALMVFQVEDVVRGTYRITLDDLCGENGGNLPKVVTFTIE